MSSPATRLGVFALLFTLACGGGDGPTNPGPTPPPPPPPPPPPGGSANFTASIEGQAWASVASATVAVAAASGTYTISGGTAQGQGISITLLNIPGPGTYPLGTGAGVSGGTAIYADPTGGWGTPLSGAAGTVTITALTTTRIAGTFSFTAAASAGGATGTRTVSNGAFDLAITSGTTTPVPESGRNVLRATLNGAAYNASTVVRVGTLATLVTFGGSNTQHSINITLQNVNATGTYTVGPGGPVSATVGAPPGGSVTGPLCCWNSSGGGSGSLVVTSLTSTRIAGTFTFTLPTAGSGAATAPMAVTNGTFDIAL